jgi:DNA-binding response OmpR family regulator
VEGYEVTTRPNAEKGLYMLRSEHFDLILLDIVMPGINGLDTASAIRKINAHVPIIFLTSQSELRIKVKGFEAGADDYLVKPFSFTELLIRIKAILRRSQKPIVSQEPEAEQFAIATYVFDSLHRKLRRGEEVKSLSQKEADLLKMLCQNKGKLVKRDMVLLHLWGKTDDYAINSMDVYLSRVRKLLKDDSSIKIENIHGSGFIINY